MEVGLQLWNVVRLASQHESKQGIESIQRTRLHAVLAATYRGRKDAQVGRTVHVVCDGVQSTAVSCQ